MPGYVYIMRKDKNRVLSFERQYKIGISKSTDRRLSEVDRAVKGSSVSLVCAYWVFWPKKIEKILHEDFKKSRNRLKRAGKGAGRTEWFKLTPIELIFLRWRLLWLSRRGVIICLVCLYVFILIVAYI